MTGSHKSDVQPHHLGGSIMVSVSGTEQAGPAEERKQSAGNDEPRQRPEGVKPGDQDREA